MAYEWWSKQEHMQIPPTDKHTHLLTSVCHKALALFHQSYINTPELLSLSQGVILWHFQSSPLTEIFLAQMVELCFEGVCNTKYNSGLSDKWNKLIRKLRLEERSFWLRTQLGIVEISKLLLQTNWKLVMCQTSYHHWHHKFCSREHLQKLKYFTNVLF